MEKLTDTRLMELVKMGDKAAFEAIIERYRAASERFAYKFVRDFQLSEDIVQECFVKLWIYREKFNTDFSFKTYFYTLIKNEAIDTIRKNKIYVPLDEDEPEPVSEETPESLFVQSEITGGIYEKLEQFRKDNGDCLYLFAVKGMRAKDIAKALGISEANVRVKVFRERAKFKKLLQKEGLL